MNKLQYSSLNAHLAEVHACRACEQELPLGPHPIVRTRADARILIVGQAPGVRVHADKPPRRECAQLWLDRLLEKLPEIQLTLLIGQYVQHHLLSNSRKSSLSETVRAWQEYAPAIIPLPHPSPRVTRHGFRGTCGSNAKFFPCCVGGSNHW